MHFGTTCRGYVPAFVTFKKLTRELTKNKEGT